MEHLAAWALTTLVGAFLGSYMAAYLKKKGENLATHEDFEKILEEVRTQTQATKEIEAKILDKSWERQRQWEIKRDVLLEVVQTLGIASDRLMYMAAVLYQAGDNQSDTWIEQKRQLISEWSAAMEKYDEKRHMASFVSSSELGNAMRDASRNMRESAGVVISNRPFSTSDMFRPIRENIAAVRILAKNELGLKEKD